MNVRPEWTCAAVQRVVVAPCGMGDCKRISIITPVEGVKVAPLGHCSVGPDTSLFVIALEYVSLKICSRLEVLVV